MIVLHNSLDADSRAFVESIAGRPGVTILDWYKGGREEWIRRGGTMKVSAFPSVVWETPAYKRPAGKSTDGKRDLDETLMPAETRMIRKPADMAAVQAEIDALNVELRRSETTGMTVRDMTLADLDKVARHDP